MQTLSSSPPQSWLSWFLKGLLVLFFAILFARVFELQIIKGDYFRTLSEGNRIRRVPISARRGEILARGGEVLVGNKEVTKKVNFDPESGFKKEIVKEKSDSQDTITEWTRVYFLKSAFAHAGGYLGIVNEEEVLKVDPNCQNKGPRRSGSFVGRGGLEEQYDCTLRGIDGEELVEVDTFGRKVRTLGTKKAIPGEDIKTTIDFSLQKKVFEVMDGKKGAIVISDPYGQILALYSSPSYDPTLFLYENPKEDAQRISALLNSEDLPLFNRVIGGSYHPGSIFKIVTATGALEEKKIDEKFLYEDLGVITINEFSYANWFFTQYGRVEGKVDLKRALARSTDTFFYKVGEFLGIDSLSSWARKFGLSEKVGIDIPGEIVGLVPTPEWKMRVKKEGWFLGNTYHVAIGQGDLAVTPIAANRIASVIASNGLLCESKFVFTSEECKSLGIKRENIEAVKSGMVAACESGGTAFPFFGFEPKVACKTGTAETEEKDKTHAWFTAFAPYDYPEIVATVIIEKGGEGSSVAAPVVKEVFDFWFHEKDKDN